MTADRPAADLWAAADRERRLARNVQETEWRRRMLRAGHIDPDQLSNQARRILAWLAEWDDWTVDGVAELLAAANRSGLHTARPAPASGSRHPIGPTAAEPETLRTDGEHGTAAEHDAAPPSELAGAGTATAGTLPLPATVDHPVRARLAAPQQRRPESPAVGL